MIITRATEYTIRAVLYLATRYPEKVVPKTDICTAEGITPAFLTKIFQPLIRRGIVHSTRGRQGGFSLAQSPEELTILDILRAAEEPLELNLCMLEEDSCARTERCVVHALWAEAKARIEEIFGRDSLAAILARAKTCS